MIARLIAREDHRDRHLDAAFAVLLAVHEERDDTAFGQAATVVLEFHAHLVLTRRDQLALSAYDRVMPRRL